MTGTVSAELEAVVLITLLDAEGNQPELEFVIDTGFSGAISMPESWIKAMGYVWSRSAASILADGSVIDVNVYEGRIIWNGVERVVPIDASEGDLLAGMDLLQGCELKIQVIPRGSVTIQSIA